MKDKKQKIDEFAQPIIDIYNQLENDMLVAIGEALKGKTNLLDTDPEAWKIQQLEALGMLDAKAIRIIRNVSGVSGRELSLMLKNIGLESIKDTEEQIRQLPPMQVVKPIPLEGSPTILSILNSAVNQATNILNLTNQSLLDATKQVYIDVVNKASLDVMSGFKTGSQALWSTLSKWAEKGLPVLTDKAGRVRSPEGYVRTVLRTSTNNMVHNMQDTRFEEYGIDLVEVSSHIGARPKCAPFQGRIYSLKQGHEKYPWIGTTSIGQPDGLFGINCGHYKHPFMEGVSIQRYEPYEEPENSERYKETQKQRYIERSIRKAKTRQEMFKAAGDEENAKRAGELVRNRQEAMRNFINDTGLTRRRDREKIFTQKDPAKTPKPKKSTIPDPNSITKRDNGVDIPVKDNTPIKVDTPKQAPPKAPDPSPKVDNKPKAVELTNSQKAKIEASHETFLTDLDRVKRYLSPEEYEMHKTKFMNGEYADSPLEVNFGTSEVIVYQQVGKMFVGKSKTIKDFNKDDIAFVDNWISKDMTAHDKADGLLLQLTEDLDSDVYMSSDDRIQMMPYFYGDQDLNDPDVIKMRQERQQQFKRTFYHELGHRVHQVPGEKLLITQDNHDKYNLNGVTINKDQWKAWKKATEQFYNKSGTTTDYQRMSYPVNGHKEYGSKGIKQHFYTEMFAESFSIYVEGDPEEYKKMEKNFPGLLQQMEQMHNMGLFPHSKDDSNSKNKDNKIKPSAPPKKRSTTKNDTTVKDEKDKKSVKAKKSKPAASKDPSPENFKDEKDVQKYFKKHYKDKIQTDLNGMDPEMVTHMPRIMEDIFEKFPQLTPNGKSNSFRAGLRVVDERYWTGAGYNKAPNASASLSQSVISFNKEKFKDKSIMIEQKKRTTKEGWASQGQDEYGTIYHELGHVIEGYIDWFEGRVTQRNYNSMKPAQQKKHKVHVSVSIQEEVLKRLDLKEAHIKRELSQYATTNEHEFFAEAFTEYMQNPNPRPVAKMFGEVLNEILNEMPEKNVKRTRDSMIV